MIVDLGLMSAEPRTREVVLTMRKVPVRVAVRGISQAETRLIAKTFPAPVPPMKKDPRGGSLSEVPDRESPAYLAQVDEYYLMQHNASVAIAAGFVLAKVDGAPSGPFPGLPRTEEELTAAKKWIVEAERQISARFSNTEIELMAVNMKMLAGGDTIKEAVHQLIVEIPKKHPTVGGDDEFADEVREAKDPLELPANYARTNEGLMMRACRAFGRDPITWPLTLSADDRDRVLADQILFEREENERHAVLRMIAEASVRA